MIDQAIAAIRAGALVVLPTDTVYGLCASPNEEAARRLYALKGRPREQPTALLFPDTSSLLEEFPSLDARIARALLPGPVTLVVPNPSERYPWLAGSRPETIGVRVPAEGPWSAVLARVGALAATSANAAGGPEPRRLGDVPEEIRAACGAVVDGGELPGIASTVIDLTGPEPAVLREGAVPVERALALVRAARSGPEVP